MHTLDEPKSDGQRLFEALTRIKKRGMGPRPRPDLRPSEMMMLHSILHCAKRRTDRGTAPEGDGVTVSELSEFTRMTPSAVSQTVKSLEKKGYAVRSFNPADRRVVLVTASEQGRETLRDAAKGFLQYLDQVTAALGKQDTQRLIELLEKLADALPDHPPTE